MSGSDPQPALVTAITCPCSEGHCPQEKSTPPLHLCHHVRRVRRPGTESCSFRCKTARLLPPQGPASAPAPPGTTRGRTHLHQCGREAQPSKRRGKPTPRSRRLPSDPPQGALKNPSRRPVAFCSSRRAAWREACKFFLNFILVAWPFEGTLNAGGSTPAPSHSGSNSHIKTGK